MTSQFMAVGPRNASTGDPNFLQQQDNGDFVSEKAVKDKKKLKIIMEPLKSLGNLDRW